MMYALSWTKNGKSYARVGNSTATGQTEHAALDAAARKESRSGPLTPRQEAAVAAAHLAVTSRPVSVAPPKTTRRSTRRRSSRPRTNRRDRVPY
jgi:hypothetical protein